MVTIKSTTISKGLDTLCAAIGWPDLRVAFALSGNGDRNRETLMTLKLSGLHSFSGLRLGATCLALLVAIACTTGDALADEDGVSFWIPGFFGSLAATPQQPGWSLISIYYHTDVSASGQCRCRA
jgi:hypothetical protein